MFKNYISFSKNPDFTEEQLSSVDKLKKLIKLYLITLLFLVLANLINKILIKIGVYQDFTQSINKLPQLTNKGFSISYLLIALVCAPVLEEFTFRLLLTKYNKKFIIISISMMFGFISYRLFYNHLWHSESIILFNFIPYLYPILFAVPIFFILNFIKFNLENIWHKHYPIIFYFVVVLFAALHITTLNINSEHYLYIPIIILPFIIYGISLGYARIRYGIIYSILLHFILNAPGIIKLLIQITHN